MVILLIVGLLLLSCPKLGRTQGTSPTASVGCAPRFLCFDYSNFNVPIAGVAGGNAVVFIGEPLNGSVAVLSRATAQQIAQLPPPPNGFVLPFIMHSLAPSAGLAPLEPPANLSYSGQLTIVAIHGTLVTNELGVLDAAHLAFTEIERPASGTGVFANPGNSVFFNPDPLSITDLDFRGT